MKHIKHQHHGESKTRLYRIWSNLKNRVLPNSVKAKYYFDRGIGLCDEWKNSFISFRDWSINNGYDEKLTLDRIDNDGSYTPENCRWVDMKVQSNNRSNNISVRIEEGCIPFSEICRVLSIDYMYAYDKVVRHLSQEIDVERTVKDWKEPVSEDLEIAAKKEAEIVNALGGEFPPNPLDMELIKTIFIHGAQWQKEKEYTCYEEAFEDGAKWKVENLWKPADGDDLPEIDREVIALLNSGKVVFAHRPYKEKYIGKNFTTGNIETFENKTYDKGGWNIPDVKYWLDVELPKEIEL